MAKSLFVQLAVALAVFGAAVGSDSSSKKTSLCSRRVCAFKEEQVCRQEVMRTCDNVCFDKPICSEVAVDAQGKTACTTKEVCQDEVKPSCSVLYETKCPEEHKKAPSTRPSDGGPVLQLAASEVAKKLFARLFNNGVVTDDGCTSVPVEKCISTTVNVCRFVETCPRKKCDFGCREVCKEKPTEFCNVQPVEVCQDIPEDCQALRNSKLTSSRTSETLF